MSILRADAPEWAPNLEVMEQQPRQQEEEEQQIGKSERCRQQLEVLSLRQRVGKKAFLRQRASAKESSAETSRVVKEEVARETAWAFVDDALNNAVQFCMQRKLKRVKLRVRSRWESTHVQLPCSLSRRRQAQKKKQKKKKKLNPHETGGKVREKQCSFLSDETVLEICLGNDAPKLMAEINCGNRIRSVDTIVDGRGFCALACAVEACAIDVLSILVHVVPSAKSSVYESGGLHASALHHAVALKNSTTLSVLLRPILSGKQRNLVNVNAKGLNGITPLHLACKLGEEECLKILLQAGADPESRDKFGNTALMFLATCVKANEVMLDLLRARILSKNKNGETALHIACGNGNDHMVAALIVRGCDRNLRDLDLRTPLAFAIGNNHASTAKLLIERGARIEPSCVHEAARFGHGDVLFMLENIGAIDVDFPSLLDSGDSLLMTALKYMNFALAAELVERGASVSKTNLKGETPLEVALRHSMPTSPPPMSLLRSLAENSSRPENMRENSRDSSLRKKKGNKSSIEVILRALLYDIPVESRRKAQQCVKLLQELLSNYETVLTDAFFEMSQEWIGKMVDAKHEAFIEKYKKLPVTLRWCMDCGEQPSNLLSSNWDNGFHFDMKRLFQNRAMLWPDCQILLEDGRLEPVHGFVLGIKAPMFSGMFESGMLESKSGKVRVAHFPPHVVMQAIAFLYSPELKPTFIIAASSAEEELLEDGHRVLELLQDAIDIIVLSNEWILDDLGNESFIALEVLLRKHLVASRLRTNKKDCAKIRSAQIKDLLKFAVEEFPSARLANLCSDALSFIEGLRKQHHDSAPKAFVETQELHDASCACPLQVLARSGARCCRVRLGELRQVSMVCDVAKVFTSMGVTRHALLRCNPDTVRQALEAHGKHHPANFVDNGLVDETEFLRILRAIHESKLLERQEEAKAIWRWMQKGDFKIWLSNNGEALLAHRAILNVRSPKFEQLFNEHENLVQVEASALSDVTATSSWRQVLFFCMAGELCEADLPESISEMCEIARLADDLGINSLAHCLEAVLQNFVEQDRTRFESEFMDMILDKSLHPTLHTFERDVRMRLLKATFQNAPIRLKNMLNSPCNHLYEKLCAKMAFENLINQAIPHADQLLLHP